MNIVTISGKTYPRVAWTGGDTPDHLFGILPEQQELINAFYEDSLADSGGLDLWACAGTSAKERVEIFRNRARLDAWRTLHP